MASTQRSLRVGLQLPTTDGFGVGYQDLVVIAKEAEQAGFDSAWVGDHFSFPAPVVESVVAATTAAAATTRIGIGFGVMLPALRHPGWVAKQISSLQTVSRDRVILGVGVGGEFPGEWEALGVPKVRRGALTDEILRVLPDLLSGRPARLGEPWGVDMPLLTPHGALPELWVGGRKDVALRRALSNGAGWLGVWLDEEALKERADRLLELAEEAGRAMPPLATELLVHPTDSQDRGREEMRYFMEAIYGIPFERVERYCLGGTPEQIADKARGLVDVGLDTIILIPAVRDALSAMPQLQQVANALRLA